jgi:hypothetical protein
MTAEPTVRALILAAVVALTVLGFVVHVLSGALDSYRTGGPLAAAPGTMP